jgi:SpoVK/Ycf46/Vps4 family AAA+-type ATPase
MSDSFENLLNKGYAFYCKGMDYYQKNEVEGALINFLLALNTLEIVKEYTNLPATTGKSKALVFNKVENKCNLGAQGITDIQEAIDTLTRRIAPLQEQLVRIKTSRAGKSDDEEGPECKNLKAHRFKTEDMISFDNIIGQDVTKKQINFGLLEPILHPRLFPQMTKGILLYGPPGTGKTMFAKALINELAKRSNALAMWLYAPTGGELKGKYVGETEKKISAYFKCASKKSSDCEASTKGAGQSISVLFIDEVEAIAGNRTDDQSGMMTNSVNTLLQEIDGVGSNKNVIVMAATNYPWKLDEAILRRFDTKIFVTLPEAEDCVEQIKLEIVTKYFKKIFKKNLSPEEAMEKLKEDEDEDKKFEAAVCPPENKPIPSSYAKIYETLKKAYFNDLDLSTFGMTLHEKGYSAGDISNICKKVFKIMGSDALQFHLKTDWESKPLISEVAAVYKDTSQYWFLKTEGTKKSLDLSQMLLQLDNKEYCDIELLEEYIKMKYPNKTKDVDERRTANLLRQTINRYIAAGEWYKSAHEKKYILTSDIHQGHGRNNTKITLLIKQKPFTEIGDYLFKDSKAFYIELEITFVGGWVSWFNRFLKVNPISYGPTTHREGELKYLIKQQPFDASARYESETFKHLYIFNEDELGIIRVTCYIQPRGGFGRLTTGGNMNRTEWDFLLSGKLIDEDGTPKNSGIDMASKTPSRQYKQYKQEQEQQEPEDGEPDQQNKEGEKGSKSYFTLLDIVQSGYEEYPMELLSESKLPVLGTFQNENFVKSDLSSALVKTTTPSDITEDMWKSMVNFKFSLNDFLEAINPNSPDSIKPTASKNILRMLNQYSEQGSLSKTDIAQIENPPTKDKNK